jgi:hypothetical protein
MNRARLIIAAIALGSVVAAAWLVLREKNVEPAVSLAHGAAEEPRATPPIALAVPSSPEHASVSIRDAPSPARAVEQDAPATTAPREPPTHVLYGYVRPAQGRTAVVDGAVVLHDPLGERQIAHCGEDGAYSFSGLAPGRYSLSSRSPGNGSARVDVDVDASSTEKRVDLQLVMPPRVLVKATDREGKPFEAHIVGLFMRLTAIATEQPPAGWLDDFSGTADGPYGAARFEPSWEANHNEPDEVLGTLSLEQPPPVYVSVVAYQRVLATKRIEPGVTEVTFVLDGNSPLIRPGSLRARFVDADTQVPIEEAQVTFEGMGGRRAAKEGDAYRATNLPPGLYEVQVFARGYERLDRRTRVTPGAEIDLGDVPLEHEQWISGTVVDAEGHGCEQQLCWDEYDRETGVARSLGTIYVVRSKSDGSFRIAKLSRRLYLVRTMSYGESSYADWSKLIDTSKGPVENVRVELVRGVPLVVRASDPEDWRSVRFKILDGSGSQVHAPQLWGTDPQKILLAPGVYTIEVRADEHAEAKRILVTIASEPVPLAIP